jgi:hypothetical protein
MRERGFGFVSKPAKISRDKDGSISDATINRLQIHLENLTNAINGGLSLKSGGALGRAGNLNGQLVEFTTPPNANTQFLVPHSLGITPEGYIVVLQNKAGSVYTSNFGGWDSTSIFLKSDATSMLVNAIVYG